MYRSLATWGFGSLDKERVVSDLARFTNGKIQLMPEDVRVSTGGTKMSQGAGARGNNRRKKK